MLTKLDKKPSNPMPMKFFEMKVRKAQEARDTAKLEKEKAEREFTEKLSVKFVSDLATIRPYLLKAMELGYGDRLVADPDSSESYSRIEHSYDFDGEHNRLRFTVIAFSNSQEMKLIIGSKVTRAFFNTVAVLNTVEDSESLLLNGSGNLLDYSTAKDIEETLGGNLSTFAADFVNDFCNDLTAGFYGDSQGA